MALPPPLPSKSPNSAPTAPGHLAILAQEADGRPLAADVEFCAVNGSASASTAASRLLQLDWERVRRSHSVTAESRVSMQFQFALQRLSGNVSLGLTQAVAT